MENLKIIGQELVPVYETDEGRKIVNGRELHEVLQSKQDFSTWIKKRLDECDAVENQDFSRFHKKMEANNATLIEYHIKLDTAKEMAMLERNDKGKQVRRYFIEVEKRYKERQKEPHPACIEDVLIQSLQEMKDIRAKVEKQGMEMKAVKDAMVLPGEEQSFSSWVSATIGNIANSPEYSDKPYRYQTAWGESYKRLQEKAGCRLDVLLKNAKKRAEENGASKAKVKAISKLHVIEIDKKLRALYIDVLREMAVAYCVEVA